MDARTQARTFALLVCAVSATSLAASASTGAALKSAPPRPRVLLHSLGRFDQPVYVTAPPGDRRRQFVVERAGRVLVVRDGRRLRVPFLDMRRDVLIRSRQEVNDQRGLLSIAVAPDYAASGRFYVFYTGLDDMLHVDELRRSRGNPDRANPTSRRAVMTLGRSGPFGQGGQLQFGPDRLLYIGVGDGDDPPAAQDLGSLRGKILRIDTRPTRGQPYGLPAGNPVPAQAGARREIFSYGLREPWRFSFDRRTGDMLVGDVGESTAEEVDLLPRGRRAVANFGWPIFEGTVRNSPGEVPNYVPPVITQLHSKGWCALIGGYVDRDRNTPSLYGRYLYADLCSGAIHTVATGRRGLRHDRVLAAAPFQVASFGEDGIGRVYLVDPSGLVERLVER